jgi:hypothetical protein
VNRRIRRIWSGRKRSCFDVDLVTLDLAVKSRARNSQKLASQSFVAMNFVEDPLDGRALKLLKSIPGIARTRGC